MKSRWCWKQGNVDYKKVPELEGVDLDRYRGKVWEEVRGNIAKSVARK